MMYLNVFYTVRKTAQQTRLVFVCVENIKHSSIYIYRRDAARSIWECVGLVQFRRIRFEQIAQFLRIIKMLKLYAMQLVLCEITKLHIVQNLCRHGTNAAKHIIYTVKHLNLTLYTTVWTLLIYLYAVWQVLIFIFPIKTRVEFKNEKPVNGTKRLIKI